MSNVLNRITGNNDRMKNSIESTQKTMNQSTDFADKMSHAEQKLEIVGQQYARQARKVEEMQEKYRQLVQEQGRHSEKTEQMKDKVLQAQLAELRLAESVEKAGEAFKKQQGAEKNVGKHIENATRKQEMFNREVNNGAGAANNLLSKIKSFVGAYISFRAAKKLFKDTVGAAGELNQRVGVMQAAFGNKDIGKHYFNKLQLYAIETKQNIDDLIDATSNFMQLTKNTNKLAGLTDIANKLSLRTRNLGSAENLIQEAIAGRSNRLQRVLHLTDSQMKPLENAVKKGSLDGIISAFNEALNTAGLTDEIVEAYQNSPIQKFYKAIDRTKLNLARAGEDALMRLEPALDKINSWLQSANADQFFGAISAGISTIVSGAVWLAETISNNWNIIRPILVVIGTVYLIYIIDKLKVIIIKLWEAIPPILAQAAAWLAAHWPILLVIAAIIIVIKVLLACGVTADQITGVIAGFFSTLAAILYNKVAFMWNLIASFAEFFVNVWKYPEYAFKKLWYDLSLAVLDFAIAGGDAVNSFANTCIKAAEAIANAFIGAFNWAKKAANSFSIDIPDWVPGIGGKSFKTNFKMTERKSFGKVDVISGLKNTKSNLKAPTKPAGAWSAPRMEYKDVTAAAKKGYKWGESLPDKFTNGFKNIQDSIKNFGDQERAWNAGQGDNLGKLNDKGKGLNDKAGKGNKKKDEIKKAIDKSNEDLKWMRDLAEQEVINRFTTATLAPQISIEFGDVKETADVDGIVDHIETILTEQINIAAEGVHE